MISYSGEWRDGTLVCPRTMQPLRRIERSKAGPLVPRVAEPGRPKPFALTEFVLLREDREAAYPIVQGVPILLAPEILTDIGQRQTFDLDDPRYAEAYLEMDFYNKVAMDEARHLARTNNLDALESEGIRHLGFVINLEPQLRENFPKPERVWLSSRFDVAAEAAAYKHLGSLSGKHCLQLGGKGIDAVLFLLAGASRSWLITPMLGEALVALELARITQVADRFACCVGIGEEIPLASESFDVVFSSGCVHHMTTELAFPEVARVLKPNGRFAAVEPWRAPFYGIGTRLFGKREANTFCRPLTPVRVQPLKESFKIAEISKHGAFTRYPLIVLGKLGLAASPSFCRAVFAVDDAVSRWIPGAKRLGSGAALLASL